MILTANTVLIQLDKKLEHSTTKSGLLVPGFNYEETDGGKLRARADESVYLSSGKVLNMSPQAAKLMIEQGTPLSEGDQVYVSPNAVSPQFQFQLDRNSRPIGFDGVIAVPTTLIQAIVN